MTDFIIGGGGPTPEISNSMVGIYQGVMEHDPTAVVYFAKHGVAGLRKGEIFKAQFTPDQIGRIKDHPTSFPGNSREKVGSEDLDLLGRVASELGIRRFFFVGGDDSAVNTNTIVEYLNSLEFRSKYGSGLGFEVQVNGVPKTIDNDLPKEAAYDESVPGIEHPRVVVVDGMVKCFDFCPGAGDAATALANIVLEQATEAESLQRHYLIEYPGRKNGEILAAACVIERFGYGPHGYFVPERATSARGNSYFDMDKFADLVMWRQKNHGWGVYLISEGVVNRDGTVWAETKVEGDGFRGSTAGGVVFKVQDFVDAQAKKFGCKVDVRPIRPGSEYARTNRSRRSPVDRDVSFRAGYDAGKWAVQEQISGYVVGIVRTETKDEPKWETSLVPCGLIAGKTSSLQPQFILEERLGRLEVNGVQRDVKTVRIDPSFERYCRPILGEIEEVEPLGEMEMVQLKCLEEVVN